MQALSQLSYGPTRARQITFQSAVCQAKESDCFTAGRNKEGCLVHLISLFRVAPCLSIETIEICSAAGFTRRQSKGKPVVRRGRKASGLRQSCAADSGGAGRRALAVSAPKYRNSDVATTASVLPPAN